MKPLCFVRSLLFYVGYLPLVVVFGTISFTIGALMPYRLRQEVVTWANAIIIRWFNFACGCRLEVTGLENIPDSPVVVLSKHQSSWETYYLQRLFRPVSTILKRELLRVPFFGWGLAMMRPIAIDRDNPREAMRQVLAIGKKRLAEGNRVVIFPEGTRIPPGQRGKYARSGAALAVAAGVPVVPIALNAGKFWPAKGFLKYPGTIKVIIGEPIRHPGGDSRELMEQVENWIESLQSTI